MRGLCTNLRLRWRALWKRRQLEGDLEDELAFHLAMRDEKNQEAGVAESARRSFGNPALVKEDLRDQWTFRAVENLWRDLRYAARMLLRSPGFTLVAVLSLAIGIGANTAIFSVVDVILLKSLPVSDPEELRVLLWTGEPRIPFHSSSGYTTTLHGIKVHGQFPYPIYKMLTASLPQFSDVIGFTYSTVTVIAGGESHYGNAHFVTGNFFEALGLRPVLGRLLSPEDERSGTAPVAVISYAYWERRFGLDPGVVGRSITIDGHPVIIAGITPRSFLGADPEGSDDLFLPLVHIGMFGDGSYKLERDDQWWVQIIGRLRPGVSDRQALAALDVVMARAGAAYPEPAKKQGPFHVVLEAGAGGVPQLREQTRTPLLILSSVVGLVLLIACANIANLLLARGVGRRRELAVRLAIGAGRGRLVRQLLTESLLLAGIGAAIGLSFASPLGSLIRSMTAVSDRPTIGSQIDARVLLFTTGVTLLTAIVFGLMPAFRATRIDLTPALKDGSTFGAAGHLRANRILVVGQVALSTLLLAGAGLFIRTLVNITRIDPGFEVHRLLIFTVDGSRSGYDGRKLTDLYERMRAKLEGIPGVQAVTLSTVALLSNGMSSSSITVPGYTPSRGQSAETYVIAAGGHFLKTMGIPVLFGRDIDGRDILKARPVALVNQTFARKFLAGRSPMGAVFYFGNERNPKPEDVIEIVGVAKDAKYDNLKNEIPPTAYIPYLQHPDWVKRMIFEVRTTVIPSNIASAVERSVAQIDRNVPVAGMRTQEEQIRITLSGERMFAGVVGSFGGIAALLAAIGLYGVMAYAVTRRTSEIGIRLALGAGRGDVQWMVLRESLWMVAAGLAIGIPAALALTKLVRGTLYGIKPNDPVSFVAAGALMVVVAALAAWIPARRAARVDPMRALRCE
jgi:predicted permease